MEKTWIPTVAGILDIVAGALSFIGVTFAFFGILMLGSIGGMYQSMGIPESLVLTLMIIFAIFGVIADILAIIGGIYALRRKNWGMALAGSIAAFFASWPLGIAAIVLTKISEKEFE